ncbi:MAG TPA: hypothetical protein VNI58_03150 [Mariprofundaceae bacterium]|nr:hypothetical protein [Mariprofundaceae bacterium]
MTCSSLLSACSNGPKMVWGVDEGRDKGPAYAQGTNQSPDAQQQAPLDVPPELKADLELPQGASVSSQAQPNELPPKYAQEVAGKAVALDARDYDFTPAQVLSATVDAMTSLNYPVESVDSPSGIVTTDWIRKGSNNPGFMAGLFGGSGSTLTRHRYIVRIFRAIVAGAEKTRLEIRVLGQQVESNHWVNAPVKVQVTNELFAAVDEQLTRMKTQPDQPVAPNATPADVPAKLPGY